ncbi:hypothetical protein [Streptomyces alkaliterrae]|uniref:EamA/RhaT family transporter n=1 Tax=Streptomyces alkaliterrae TaxID=2213162 RepID=A0A5P0YZE5_9ACTN|nr:hypothetical protein [Streptomyces alkaliterrae]MBB1254502.1 hypothetical protein [Streptomyces alkaliterrae]MBB1260983.1 hypothetical protein [Streptomyces alkaliterrae]MQS04972.1 hypothetical protein [Streptomyces alkaliterrae]
MNDATPERRLPAPEPIRFYGTTWVDHSGGYRLRRAGLALAAFAAAAAGALLLRFAYQGLEIAEVGTVLNLLVVLAFAACSSIAFSKTWGAYTKPRRVPRDQREESAERSLASVRMIGFIGVLLAYGIRTLVEAPGEKLRRAEHEEAVRLHERRRSARTGNPAARDRTRGKRRR